MNYRTEIYVADDRYVCLQLPDFVPLGKAVVTVSFIEDDPILAEDEEQEDDDRDAVAWWDRDDEPGRGFD